VHQKVLGEWQRDVGNSYLHWTRKRRFRARGNNSRIFGVWDKRQDHVRDCSGAEYGMICILNHTIGSLGWI